MGVLNYAAVGASVVSAALAGTVPADGKIWTSCVTPGTIALTFDDGPYIYTQSIVDQLTAAGHKATFFQNGQNWDSIYNYNSTLQSMIAGGHQIGSHTWSHADLTTLTADQIEAEMTELEVAHQAIIGKVPTYMRPPYLATNAQVLSTLEGLSYKIIEVDIDTQDWAEDDIGGVQLSIDWYEGNQTAGGSLSLNHDPYQATADTFVPAIIAYLKGKGLTSVPVGECIGDDAANWYKGGAAAPSGSASASAGAPTGSGAPSNGTAPPPTKPTKSVALPPAPSNHGGDTEAGHGGDAGRGSIPGHSGQGDNAPNAQGSWGKPAGGDTGSSTSGGPSSSWGSGGSSSSWGSGTSGSGHAGNGTGSASPSPSYYVNSANGLTASAVIIGAAALALFL